MNYKMYIKHNNIGGKKTNTNNYNSKILIILIIVVYWMFKKQLFFSNDNQFVRKKTNYKMNIEIVFEMLKSLLKVLCSPLRYDHRQFLFKFIKSANRLVSKLRKYVSKRLSKLVLVGN